jgi:phosphatidylglycerol---prolipoprotein diacylglyceryl transferase
MYPDFHELARYLLGIEHPWPWLSILKVFGFLVALSFLGAAWTLTLELKRKEKLGLLFPTYSEVETGHKLKPMEVVIAAFIGFILGYKVGGLFTNWNEVGNSPITYIFSFSGNVLFGLLVAALMGYSKYSERKKQELPEPVKKKVATYPHQRVGEFVVIAAIGGLAGAKIFNAFETWDDFIHHPVDNLLSSSGLTFYGGLIVAAIAMYYFARKHKIRFVHLCDAVAPGLMLAYGFGRFGCHFAGDGDWGIANSAYVTDTATGQLVNATPESFHTALLKAPEYVSREFGGLDKVMSAHAHAPGWLPDWLFAMNYQHNVNNIGIPLSNCTGNYCSVLPVGVFPTSLYEAVTCIILFFILWAMRKRISRPFHLFGIYLVLNGLERFFIEKVRVNYKYDWGFIHPTQAEIISTCLVLAGLGILIFYKGKNNPRPHVDPALN